MKEMGVRAALNSLRYEYDRVDGIYFNYPTLRRELLLIFGGLAEDRLVDLEVAVLGWQFYLPLFRSLELDP